MTKTVEEEVALLRTLAVEATALRTKIEETPGEISEKDELRMKEQDEEFDRSVNRLATIDPMLAKAAALFFQDQRRLDIPPAQLAMLYTAAANVFAQA